MKDFYAILGTAINCTPIEITEAYKKLAKKFHPDLNPGDDYFENRFEEIRQAYETLSDPVKRKRYDAALKKYRPYSPLKEPKKLPSYLQTKKIDIAFTIILIGITVLFGMYVIRSISGTAPKVNKTSTLSPSLNVTHHHKKKHRNKANGVFTTNKKTAVKTDTISTAPVQPTPTGVTQTSLNVRAPVNTNIRRESPTATITPGNNTGNSYATIRSNSTGMVYLRTTDNYGSAIIGKIPNQSKVLVLEKGPVFYKVLFDSQAGYVPKWVIQVK